MAIVRTSNTINGLVNDATTARIVTLTPTTQEVANQQVMPNSGRMNPLAGNPTGGMGAAIGGNNFQFSFTNNTANGQIVILGNPSLFAQLVAQMKLQGVASEGAEIALVASVGYANFNALLLSNYSLRIKQLLVMNSNAMASMAARGAGVVSGGLGNNMSVGTMYPSYYPQDQNFSSAVYSNDTTFYTTQAWGLEVLAGESLSFSIDLDNSLRNTPPEQDFVMIRQ